MEGLCLDEIDIGGLVNALQGSKMSIARSPISPDEAPAWRPRTQQPSKNVTGVDTQLPAMVGTKLQQASAIRSFLQSPVAVRKKAVRTCPQPFLLVEVENKPTVEAMHTAAKVIQIAYREIAIRRMLRAEAHAEAAAAQSLMQGPQMTSAVPSPPAAGVPAATTLSKSRPPQVLEGMAPPPPSSKPRPARRRLKARRRKKVQQQQQTSAVAGVLPPPAPVQKAVECKPQPAVLAAPMPPTLPPPAPKARKRRRVPEAACDAGMQLPSAGVAEASPAEASLSEALPEHIRLLIEDSESKGDRYQDELLTLRWQPRYQPVSEEEGGQESKHAEARPASAMGCEASTSKHKKRSRRVRSWKAIKKAVRKVRGKSKKNKNKSKNKEKKIKNRATSPPPELRRRNSAPATAMFSPDRRKTRMSVADRNVELGMACLQLLGDNGVSPVSACRATEMFFTSTRELKVNLEPGTSFKSVMAELEALQQEAQQEQE